MGTDTVDEPAVVADDNGVASKLTQRVFDGKQDVHVRLIEQDNAVAFLEHPPGQVNAIAFTTRRHPDFLLLVGTPES